VIRDSGDEFVEYDPNVRARLIELLLGLPPQGSSTPSGFYLQPNNTLGNRPPETNVLAELLFKSSEQPSGAQFRPIWPEPGDAPSRLMRPQVKRSIFVSYHDGGDRYYYDLFSKRVLRSVRRGPRQLAGARHRQRRPGLRQGPPAHRKYAPQ
jgi:hypothetical protein